MIRVATTAQAQEIDQQTQLGLSLPARLLMNTAGRKAAEKIQKIFPDKNLRIVILCGPGNNGGDGVVVFRELLSMGYTQIQCFLATMPKSTTLIEQIRSIKQKIPTLTSPAIIPTADLYVDALFGIGLNQEITDNLKKVVETMNDSRQLKGSHTVSLDVPSGLCSDTGTIKGVCVEADHTITFGITKLGQWIQEGPRVCGKCHVVDIGFPKTTVNSIANSHFVFTRKDFVKHFPKRPSTTNKSNYGHVKVWAGSDGMWGAAVLTARAAYRAGAGYVTIESNAPFFSELPEVLVEKQSPIDKKFTYAVGPGWGKQDSHQDRLRDLFNGDITNVVLDADALNTIARVREMLPLRSDWILTPHSKELSRLLNIEDTQIIEKDRARHVADAAKKLNAIVLLKGFRTLVSTNGKVFIIPVGNSALAKAGSGDVLTGIISGLRAQNISAPLAALLGAYLHGLMADIWIQKNESCTLTPSDLLNGLPRMLKTLLQQSR